MLKCIGFDVEQVLSARRLFLKRKCAWRSTQNLIFLRGVAQFGRTSFALLDADQAKRVRVQRKGASQPTGREATISQTEVRVALYPKFNISSGCGSVR